MNKWLGYYLILCHTVKRVKVLIEMYGIIFRAESEGMETKAKDEKSGYLM
jgi:hypothetical protein